MMFIVHVSSSEMCVPRNLKLEINNDLFCFLDVKDQIVLRAPPHQLLYLLSIGRLIASGDQPHHSRIVCEFDNSVIIIQWYTIMCIQRKEKRA